MASDPTHPYAEVSRSSHVTRQRPSPSHGSGLPAWQSLEGVLLVLLSSRILFSCEDFPLTSHQSLLTVQFWLRLKEDHLRCLLTESGKMRRWEEARRETPEEFEVLYPPPLLDADALRRVAESATALNSSMILPLWKNPKISWLRDRLFPHFFPRSSTRSSLQGFLLDQPSCTACSLKT